MKIAILGALFLASVINAFYQLNILPQISFGIAAVVALILWLGCAIGWPKTYFKPSMFVAAMCYGVAAFTGYIWLFEHLLGGTHGYQLCFGG